jgi:hypothetical protein
MKHAIICHLDLGFHLSLGFWHWDLDVGHFFTIVAKPTFLPPEISREANGLREILFN